MTRHHKGLLDGVLRVRYNFGAGFEEAYALHVVDEHTLILCDNKLQPINDGNAVPERAEEDYGPEGGGVTWTHY